MSGINFLFDSDCRILCSRTIWTHASGLHSVGLHHHDLEPRNVAKDGNGMLRILDFELSSLDESYSCGELERLGKVFDSLMEWRQ